jgi:hypothetical protein
MYVSGAKITISITALFNHHCLRIQRYKVMHKTDLKNLLHQGIWAILHQ